MYSANLFDVILTPNYDSAHDNHFHVDLSGSNFIMSSGGGYIGPNEGH